MRMRLSFWMRHIAQSEQYNSKFPDEFRAIVLPGQTTKKPSEFPRATVSSLNGRHKWPRGLFRGIFFGIRLRGVFLLLWSVLFGGIRLRRFVGLAFILLGIRI